MKRRLLKNKKPDPKPGRSNAHSYAEGTSGGIVQKAPATGVDFIDQMNTGDTGEVQLKKSNSIPSGIDVKTNSKEAIDHGALAFAKGNSLHFAPGQFNPSTQSGKKLIGHELAHVIQQKEGRVKPTTTSNGVAVNDDSNLEKEADDFGQQFASGKVPSDHPKNSISGSATSNPIQKYDDVNVGTDIQWATADSVSPSTEGVKGGVFFIEVGGMTHVVKAADNVASTLFAEKILAEVGGAVTSASRPILVSSEEGTAILDKIREYVPEDEGAVKVKYSEKLDHFEKAQYFVVQNFIQGDKMGTKNLYYDTDLDPNDIDPKVQSQIANVLTNADLLKNIGKTLVADALIGNSDRFEKMNIGNAMILQGGQIGAIDTEAKLQGYEDYQKSAGMKDTVWELSGKDAAGWVGHLSGGQELPQVPGQNTGDTSAQIENLFARFDWWFKNLFVLEFLWKDNTHAITQAYEELGFPRPEAEHFQQSNWMTVKQHIQTGMTEALATANQMTGGQQMENLKDLFTGMQEQFAQEDPNFDLQALEARATMMKGLSAGRSMDDIKADLVSQIEFSHLISVDDAKLVVPVKPKKRGIKETARRKREQKRTSGQVGVYESEEDKNSQRLKDMARTPVGGVSMDLLAQVEGQQDGDALKGQKAIFEARLRLFKDYMNAKTGIMNFLIADIKKTKLLMQGEAENPNTAAAAAKYAQFRAKDIGINTMEGSFSIAYHDFFAKLKPDSKFKKTPTNEQLALKAVRDTFIQAKVKLMSEL